MMLTELRKVIPSFLQRVDVAERGGEWTAYLVATREDTARVLDRLWPDDQPGLTGLAGVTGLTGLAGVTGGDPSGDSSGDPPAEVTLLDFDPDGEDKVLAAA